MASRKILVQLDIAAASNLTSPSSGFVGFSAKADGLYQKIGTAPELRLLTSADVQNAILADGSITGAVSQAQIFTMGVKLYNLTQGYVPYASAATKLLSNSPIYTDGTNVGIGTTNVPFKFQVNGAEKLLSVNSTATTTGLTLVARFSGDYGNSLSIRPQLNTGSYNPIVIDGDFGIIFDKSAAKIGVLTIAPWSSVKSGIRISASASNPTIEMQGNVGIGTVPNFTLDVNGVARFGSASGGTNNGNLIISKDDMYPNISFRSGNTIKAQILANVVSGFLYFDTLGSFNIRNAINGGTTVFAVLNNGNVSIGTTSPTASLHIKAGTATVNTAPIKLTSGVNLTTPESGAIEFSSSRLYFTPSTTRETVAFISDITAASHSPVTIGAIGSAPNANGMSISGQILSLQPASALYGGVLTNSAQTIAGAKTFSSLLTASAGIANNGSYTQTGTSANTFTGNSTFAGLTITGTILGDTDSARNLMANNVYTSGLAGYQYTNGRILVSGSLNRMVLSRESFYETNRAKTLTPGYYSVSFWYKVESYTSGTALAPNLNDVALATLNVSGNKAWTFYSSTVYMTTTSYGFLVIEGTFGSTVTISDIMIVRSAKTPQQYVLAPEDIIQYDSIGNVGIGTADPGAYKLNVNGNTNITGNLNLSSLTASKVVFTDGLKNLTSTGIGTAAQFIKGDGSLDSNTYITSGSISGFVPYTGATQDVNIGTFGIAAGYAFIGGLQLFNNYIQENEVGINYNDVYTLAAFDTLNLIYSYGSNKLRISDSGDVSIDKSLTIGNTNTSSYTDGGFLRVARPGTGYAGFDFYSKDTYNEFGVVSIVANPEEGIMLTAKANDNSMNSSLMMGALELGFYTNSLKRLEIAQSGSINAFGNTITSTGGFIGNASTATKLQTARTITIGNQSLSFDGTANLTYSLANIGVPTGSGVAERITFWNGTNTFSSSPNLMWFNDYNTLSTYSIYLANNFRLGTSTTAGYVLTADANGNGTWQAPGGSITGSGVSGRITFWNGTNSLSSTSNLEWNNTTKNLGVTGGVVANSVSASISVSTNSLLTNSFSLIATTTAGYVLTTDAYGNGTWQAPTGGGSYTLPTATASVLGGVKIGSGITISSGVISVSTNYQAPITTGTTLQYLRGDLSLATFPTIHTGSGVDGRVTFWNGTNSLSSNSNLTWDNTNNKLSVYSISIANSFKLGTSATAGYVLTTDANGNGTWQAPPTGGGLYTDARYNTAGGIRAGLHLLIDAERNTFLGYEAGRENTTGSYNTFLGYEAGLANTSGEDNTAIGSVSLANNTSGYQNTAIGKASLISNLTGHNNSANGFESLTGNTTGNDNTANGGSSLCVNSTGYSNTANGSSSLYANATGSYNTASGSSSLYFNTTGNYNIAMGYLAGSILSDGTTGRSTGNNGIYLGCNTRASANGTTNEIVIGNGAIGEGSNTITLGSDSIIKTILKGRLKLKTVPSVYADNSSAITGGLSAGEIYRTSIGVLMIVY